MAGAAESRAWKVVVWRLTVQRRLPWLWTWVGTVVVPVVLLALLERGTARAQLVTGALVSLVPVILLVIRPAPAVPRPLAVALTDALDGLCSERLVLRRARRNDAASLAATVDDEVMTVNGWPRGAEQQVLHGLGSWKVRPLQPRVLVVDRHAGNVRGYLSLVNVDEDASSCEIGWWVGPDSRRQGYATETVEAALPALHDAGLHRVRFGTSPDNLAIQRIAAHVGARQEASRPHVLPNGETVESLWFVHEEPQVTVAG